MKIKLVSCVLILLFALALPIQAEAPKGKSAPDAALTVDNSTFIDANKILMFVTNHGNFGRDLAGIFGYDYGTWFPYTGDTADIQGNVDNAADYSPYYAGGLWIGAVDSATSEVRVTISEYSSEYVPGPMAGGTFLPDDPAFRVYKIYADSTGANANNDYLNWPVSQGAPLDSLGNPELIGDQTTFAVFNDADPAGHNNDAGESNPLGLEVRMSTFAFDREDPLGNIVFLRFRVYNNGANTLEDCYFSIWSDPDLGGAGDDLVGCDTALGLGFIYNATNDDSQYDIPPALGIDFFQGPLIQTGDLADTAIMWGQTWPGYVNMRMTSFNKYINGTDPEDKFESYNYMRGFNADGSPYINPATGAESKFVHTGDPVTGSGDLDIAPADRRYMMTTGPVTFRPGDSTEIVAAMIVGHAVDRLTSISLMKFYDQFAQLTYNNFFEVLEPPASPQVNVGIDKGAIILSWNDVSEVNHGSYPFEGYTVSQGLTAAGPWTQVANYDLINETEDVFDLVFDPVTAVPETRLVKNGTNSGIKRYIVLTQDYINGGDLNNLTRYFYKVDAYSYEPLPPGEPADGLRTLTAATTVSAVPQAPAGEEFQSEALETLPVTHTTGGSDGVITPIVVDPGALTGDNYEVTFSDDTLVSVIPAYEDSFFTYTTLTDTCGASWDEEADTIIIVYCVDTTLDSVVLNPAEDDTSAVTVWHWVNVTTGDTLAGYIQNQSGDDDYPIAEGIQLKVAGPEFGVKAIQEVAGAGGTPIDPPDNVMFSLNSTVDWYIASDAGSDFSRLNWRGKIGTYDWEIRFTTDSSQYYDWNTDDIWGTDAPFEFWNIGIGTPNDPSDDIRIFFSIIDDDLSGGWSFDDRIYPWEVEYFEPAPASAGGLYVFDDDFRIGRIVIQDYSGALTQPAEGTVIRFTTAKVNTSEDVFAFSSSAPVATSGEQALDNIKAVPNPFYLYGSYDPAPGSYTVKFSNLPAECTITIYNLAGELIRTVTKNDPSTSIAEWDVLTEQGLPVASGIYIYVVDAPGYGQKIGKMAIFVEKEVLDIY